MVKICHFGVISWAKRVHLGLNGLNSRTVQRVSFWPISSPSRPLYSLKKAVWEVISMESGYLGLIGEIGQFWSNGPVASEHLVRRPVFKRHDISETGSISGICLWAIPECHFGAKTGFL